MSVGLRVLVTAYACEPGKGSEPAVGWNVVRQIGRVHDVWVITRANNRAPVERACAAVPLPRVRWVFFDLPAWCRFWKRGGRGVHLYYYLWQVGAYFVARRLHRGVGFDLVHHVTFVNWWIPSFVSFLPIPFIWGPVGGGESAPRPFLRDLSRAGRIGELGRDAVRWLAERSLIVRATARRSMLSLAATPETAAVLRRLGARCVVVFSQAALPAEEISQFAKIPARRSPPFRVVSVCRLVSWKGLHLAMRAFADVVRDQQDSEYWIAGDGPEHHRLMRLTEQLGIGERVRFLGEIPRDRVPAILGACDVLLHPSLHDSGGWVSLEAMAAGRPVVCLDLGGPALQVTEETGIKIAAVSPDQVARDMSRAIRRLAGDPATRAWMGASARRRVAGRFCWDEKGESFRRMYAQVLEGEEVTGAGPVAIARDAAG